MKKLPLLVLLLVACALRLDGQNSRIFYQSEVMAIREAMDAKDLDAARRHLQKAEAYAAAENRNELNVLGIRLFAAAEDYVEAEKRLNVLLAENENVRQDFPEVVELAAEIRQKSLEQQKIALAKKADDDAWASANKDSVSHVKGYLKSHPKGLHVREAKRLLGQLFVKKASRLDFDDLQLLPQHRLEETPGTAPGEVFYLNTSSLNGYQQFPNLLVLDFSHAELLDAEQRPNANSPTLSKKNLLGDLNKTRVQSLEIQDCRFQNGKLKDDLTSASMRYFRVKNTNLTDLSTLDFPNLRYLELTNNQFSDVPKITPYVKNRLEYLLLGNNAIRDFPSFITECPNLRQLVLRENKLERLSPKLYLLEQLEYLDLSYNPLETVPTEIYLLKNLKTLGLYGLQVSTMPAGIQRLEKLEALGLGGNLQALPPGMEQLTSLKYLTLVGLTRMKSFPEELEHFKKLETLHLEQNPWKEVPKGIAKLLRIKELHLKDFGLTAIPAILYRMPNLQSVSLANNQIYIVDDEVKKLAHLDAFDLSQCPLEAAALVKLRFALPKTTLTYLDPHLKKDVSSKPIEEMPLSEFHEKYRYHLEGDIQSSYELGVFFKNRGDAGIAYYFFKLGTENTRLSGKGKGLINNLAIAEMYEASQSLDQIINNIRYDNWTGGLDAVLNSVAFKEYRSICNCSPRDDGGWKIVVNSCDKVLDLHYATIDRLKNVMYDARQQYDNNTAAGERRMETATTLFDIGSFITNEGLDNFTGIGALAGATAAQVAVSSAQNKMNAAEYAKYTVEKLETKILDLQAEADAIDRIRKSLKSKK